mmetsp:Transcript_16205/g.18164  ORF Transcript_16205/g.18164 Transcript_16205/m.18164 type:complete len:133 (+) Transcript_16205:83-481(+)
MTNSSYQNNVINKDDISLKAKASSPLSFIVSGKKKVAAVVIVSLAAIAGVGLLGGNTSAALFMASLTSVLPACYGKRDHSCKLKENCKTNADCPLFENSKGNKKSCCAYFGFYGRTCGAESLLKSGLHCIAK